MVVVASSTNQARHRGDGDASEGWREHLEEEIAEKQAGELVLDRKNVLRIRAAQLGFRALPTIRISAANLPSGRKV